MVILGFQRIQSKTKEMMNLQVQVLQLRKKKVILQRNEIQENLCGLEDTPSLMEELEKSQKKFFKIQLEIFKLILDVISEKERLFQHERKNFEREDTPSNATEKQYGSLEVGPTNLDSLPSCNGDEEEDDFHDCEDKLPATDSSDVEEDEFFDSESTQALVFNVPSSGSFVNKWETSRKQLLVETEEMKQKKEILKSINRLYRKRAWVRNRQVCTVFSLQLFEN